MNRPGSFGVNLGLFPAPLRQGFGGQAHDSSNTQDNFEFSRVVRYRDSKDGVLPCVT